MIKDAHPHSISSIFNNIQFLNINVNINGGNEIGMIYSMI